MPTIDDSGAVKSVRKSALELLAGLYMFPQKDASLAASLKPRFPGLVQKDVKDCLSYLGKKGYLSVHRTGRRPATFQITPLGIDIVDGALNDQGIIPTRPDPAALMAKKAVRSGVVAYCRQYPESFNGDDEIHIDLLDQGMERLLLDDVRYHIWYLAGKEYLEMKTHPASNGVIYLARITARGMDLADGVLSDAGVTNDE
ncbi:MAG: hypothetical protein HZB29_13860 [Nitrospinae bacterium]|nr:hypothetical protein [Nitrospinota bacterium]